MNALNFIFSRIMFSRLVLWCNGSRVQPFSMRGVPLLLMKSAPVNTSSSLRQASQKLGQAANKSSKRGELWSLLALAQPEKFRIAGIQLIYFN